MSRDRGTEWRDDGAMTVVVGALAVLGGLLGAGLHAVNAAAGRTSTPSFWLMSVTGAIAFGSTCLLLHRSDAGRVRALLGAIGLGQGLSLTALELARMLPDTGLRDATLWLGSWVWAPAYMAIAILLPFLLPDGRLPSRRWRPAWWWGVVTVGVVAVRWALTPYDQQDFPEPVQDARNPVSWAPATSSVVGYAELLLLVVAVPTAVLTLWSRWRRAVDVECQQLKWVFLGYLATLALFAGAQVAPLPLVELTAGVAMLPLPLTIGVAVLRFGLWDVNVVISRTLVYGGLSAAVVALYVVTVWLVSDLLGPTIGAQVLATTAVALAALPLRTWLQRHVNRWVHGDVEEPYAVLARLGGRLAAAAAPDDLTNRVLPSVLEGIAGSLGARHARLTLRDGHVTAYGAGAPGDPTVRVDLEYAGERVGSLEVGRTVGFDAGALAALDRLASQAAVAAHTVWLSREAQRAREAAVLAREEERRRLRRDLHDGIGPSLAALALQVETARDLAIEDPEAASGLLDRLAPQLNAAVADVRAIVHDLRPPMLDELGLAAALDELARGLSSRVTSVRLRNTEPRALPAAVEVAAYRIAGEAVTNAVRHARARVVEVSLEDRGEMLSVQVRDDGAGLATPARPGLGMRSMRERAEELGGRLLVSSGPTGTTIEALLPKGAW